MKAIIDHVIRKCEKCTRIKGKNKRGYPFIETTRQMEKDELDIMIIDGKLLLLAIDYHTIFIFGKKIENLSAKSVLSVIKEWCEDNKPE